MRRQHAEDVVPGNATPHRALGLESGHKSHDDWSSGGWCVPQPVTGMNLPVARGRLAPMIDAFAKQYLHDDLRRIRETVLWKLTATVLNHPHMAS